MINEI